MLPKSWIAAVATLWLVAAVAGLYMVWGYDNAPGLAATASPAWPTNTHLIRATDRPTLVFLAHPQCTCTRASLGELAEALARSENKPKTYVVFLKPSSMPEGWEKTDLWEAAARLPDTTIVRDDDGREAIAFGGATSGQTFVYDAAGHLQFSGGITGSRGHAGDNDGRSSIVALLNSHKSNRSTTNVYGCSLFAAAKS